MGGLGGAELSRLLGMAVFVGYTSGFGFVVVVVVVGGGGGKGGTWVHGVMRDLFIGFPPVALEVADEDSPASETV